MRPGRRLLHLVLLVVVASVGGLVWPRSAPALIALTAVGVGFALRDLRRLRRTPEVQPRRVVATSLPLGVWSPVGLEVENPAGRPLRLLLTEVHPSSWQSRGLPVRLDLAPGEEVEIEYSVRPWQRGSETLGPCEVWIESPFGLWERRWRPGPGTAVRVLPNFRPLLKYSWLALDNRLEEMGIRVQRRRGEGLEFNQLRDYRPGDSQRQIDWKATCRRQKLISREYQDERDQRLVLLLDCGRRMRAQDGPISHFDQVLNAALLLTHAAVRKGDAVGLATFAGSRRWVPPTKGLAATSAVLEAVYDLQVTRETPDFSLAATQLAARLRRRSLIVLVTNVRDEDISDLEPAVRVLGGKHLVLVASLRERALREALAAPPRTLDDAILTSAVLVYDEARRRAHDRLAGRGVLTLDSEPDELPVALVNKYLEIKRRGIL